MQDKPRHNPARPVGVTVRSLHAIGRVEVSVDLLERNSTLREPIVSVVAPTSSEAASLAIREVDALASEARWAVRSVFGPLAPAEAPEVPDESDKRGRYWYDRAKKLEAAKCTQCGLAPGYAPTSGDYTEKPTALERVPAPLAPANYTPAEILRRITLARMPTIANACRARRLDPGENGRLTLAE